MGLNREPEVFLAGYDVLRSPLFPEYQAELDKIQEKDSNDEAEISYRYEEHENESKVLVQKPRFVWLLEVPTQSPEDDEYNTQPLPADRRQNDGLGSTYLNEAIDMLNPSELGFKDTKFIKDGFSFSDVRQGRVGESWFMASIASLTVFPKNLAYMIQRQKNKAKPNGPFEFHFFDMHQWVPVFVDNELPRMWTSRRLTPQIDPSSTDNRPNELWLAYCEKAYAKLNGGYSSIEAGQAVEAMADITGGFPVRTTLSTTKYLKETWNFLYRNQGDMVITSCIYNNDKSGVENELQNGLYDGHEYSLLKVEIVKNSDNEFVKLVMLRNPWGNFKGKFIGDWSEESDKWATLPDETNTRLRSAWPDGGFWMGYDEWLKSFDEFTFCRIPKITYGGYIEPEFEWKKYHCLNGTFKKHLVSFKLVARSKQEIWIQPLFDDGRNRRDEYRIFLCVRDNRDGGNQVVLPTYPTDYSYRNLVPYTKESYVFHLNSGNYTIELESFSKNCEPKFEQGRAWALRCFGEDLSLKQL